MAAVLLACLVSLAPVRIGVLSLLAPVRVEIVSTAASLGLPDGRTLAPGSRLVVELEGKSLSARAPDWRWTGRALKIGGERARLDVVVVGKEIRARSIAGWLEIVPERGRLKLVAVTDLESTVATATAAEMDGATETEALAAAAVTIRSFLVSSVGRHARDGYDVCDTTHCFVSRGSAPPETPAGRAALVASERTRGIVLMHGESEVVGYFAACCGGSTTTPSRLWGVPDTGAYVSVACRSCVASRYFEWRRRLDAADVRASLHGILGRPVATSDSVELVTNGDGYVRAVVVAAARGRATAGGEDFRLRIGRRLGWDAIPSPRYSMTRVSGGFELVGAGHGHGIGLCLAGALAMAKDGADWGEILRRYYPRCRAVSRW
jgi:stage II sporulation protein D